MDLFVPAAIQVGMEKALKGVGGFANVIISSKARGTELEKKLLLLKPTIDEIISCLDSLTNGSEQHKVFQAVLRDALHLVEESSQIHSLNVLEKYSYGIKIRKFEEKIQDFIDIQGPPNLALDIKKLMADVRDLGRRFDLIERLVLQQIDPTQLSQTPIHGIRRATSFNVPQVLDLPNEFAVGLDKPIIDVKKILMQNGVNIVGVTGMGGSGKTTLASALCNDTEVQASFQNNIHFITVSQLHRNENGLLEILGTMWDHIIGGDRPCFRGIEDAHNRLQNNLKRIAETTYRPILVVLDDVWSKSNLNRLLFEAEGYKTIVTTRNVSTISETTNARLYSMPMLEDAHALSLFCFWAFGRPSIPATEKEDLVKQVESECKGLPLALKVIGSSLHGKPRPVWKSAKEKLSRAELISEDHKDDLLSRLETSIDILNDKEKQCFLDLGAFPKGKRFSVDSLLDIWVYVREMEWADALEVLLELASRNLLILTGYPGSAAIEYSCASELSFSQHDVMRDLALRLASQDSSCVHGKRLFMPCKESKIPTKWLSTLKDQSSGAQFVSIHTGTMEEQDWCHHDFPEVEALALFFSASQYCLPTFLHSMPKLKVLIIYNYSSMRAKLELPSFPSHVPIRSVLLNKLILPPRFYEKCRSWESLEKLYVCLCEGLGNSNLLGKEFEALNFPNILEINFDHCSDLKELPIKTCNLASLQTLSVTNCHSIQNLPDDLGWLSSLKILRLSSCPSLSRLPPSMCKLGQLEYVDISLCRCLEELPTEFDQLSNLETLDMRECSGLKKLPIVKQRSLKRVILCDRDEKSKRAWLSIKASAIHNLTIDVVAELFSLDWLND